MSLLCHVFDMSYFCHAIFLSCHVFVYVMFLSCHVFVIYVFIMSYHVFVMSCFCYVVLLLCHVMFLLCHVFVMSYYFMSHIACVHADLIGKLLLTTHG